MRHPDVRTSLSQQPRHVGAYEPGRPCDCNACPGVLVRCPLGKTSRSRPCSCRH